MRPLFYNKNNKIIVKFNDNALIEKIKKQDFKKIIYKINTYFIKNNITITKLCIVQILSSKNIAV